VDNVDDKPVVLSFPVIVHTLVSSSNPALKQVKSLSQFLRKHIGAVYFKEKEPSP